MSENSLSPNTVWRKCTEGGEGTMTAFVERLTENSHTPRLSSAEGCRSIVFQGHKQTPEGMSLSVCASPAHSVDEKVCVRERENKTHQV